jgi:hypothetical protein
MKRFVFSAIAVLLFLNPYLQAQDSYEDVVYLKNGSVFRGMIFEIVPGKSITIEAENHFVYTVTYEQIERIRKEPRQRISTSISSYSSDAEFSTPHYTNLFQIGMLTRRAQPLTTFGLIRSANAGEHSTLGIGLGWDAYGLGAMVPLFVDARSFLFREETSPFVFTDVGYSLGLFKQRNVWDAGGFVLNAGAGFSVPSSTGATFVMEVSYRMQKTTDLASEFNYFYSPYGYQVSTTTYETKVTREFVAVTVGIGF